MNKDEKIAVIMEKNKDVPFYNFIGMEFGEAGENFAEVLLDVKKETMNVHGVLLGVMYYALCDVSTSVAVEYGLPEGYYYVTNDINVSVISSVNSGKVRARAEVLKSGKRLAFVESRVYNDQDELLAVGRVTKTRLAKKPDQS
ncbi:MAG TPA: PaaI family thioesterase [Syntrophomonas sp.]|nr:PaaI family thioesterase [Syntrophomonas sp.]